METFSALLAICAGNSPVPGEFPAQRPVTRSFDVFFDLRLNKRLSKQSWGWWFETLLYPLWRHCNAQMQRASCAKWRSQPIGCHSYTCNKYRHELFNLGIKEFEFVSTNQTHDTWSAYSKTWWLYRMRCFSWIEKNINFQRITIGYCVLVSLWWKLAIWFSYRLGPDGATILNNLKKSLRSNSLTPQNY